MSPLTCSEVEAHIELYAADECDSPTRAAVRRHLAGCPACAQAHEEVRQLLGLLTVRFQEEEGIERLQARLAAEARRSRLRSGVLPFVRRAAAMAAALLLTVGPFSWLWLARSPILVPARLPSLAVVWADADAHRTMTTAQRGDKYQVELSEGEFWARSAADPGVSTEVEVRTPAGVATIQGTEFFLKVQPAAEGATKAQV